MNRVLLCTRWLLALGLLAAARTGQAQILQDMIQGQKQGAIADFGSGSPAPVAGPSATPSGDFQAAKILTRVPVAYPLLANLNRIQGVITIRFFIDEAGHVTHTAVVATGAEPLLHQLTNDPGLVQWTFQPATLNGKPVPSTHDLEFEFRLDPAEEKKLALHRLALPIGTPDPPYPAAAAANHLAGNPTIAVFWTKEGLVGKIALMKSSGHPLLDAAALRFAYENWRIDPAATKLDQQFVKTIQFAPPPTAPR